MLRSPADTALDEVAEACKAAADHYDFLAASPQAGDLEELFRTLQQEHAEAATALMDEIRRLGNLPSVPDADREAVEHLATRLRAAFSRDERSVLLEESRKVESTLTTRLAEARKMEYSPHVQSVLQKVQGTVETALARLAAAE